MNNIFKQNTLNAIVFTIYLLNSENHDLQVCNFVIADPKVGEQHI